jgi:glutathione S-transferase
MSLKLYFHPLSSFCQKVLIALYENETPFVPHVVDFSDPVAAAEFKKIWPIGKFPVLRDEARDRIIPESSIIIEYLGQHHPGATRFLPDNPQLARQTRMRDRFFDLYLQVPMQKIVGDRLRPADKKDAFGVEQARAQLQTALGMVDRDMAANIWAMGDTFGMADCAAAPALYYANLVAPFAGTHKNAAAYLDRLMQRPSYARAVKEAEPHLALFPRK